jgi:hypothetical protein
MNGHGGRTGAGRPALAESKKGAHRGGDVMGRRIPSVVAVLALLFGLAGPARADAEAIGQATTAARSWLTLLDGQEFDESWRMAGKLLKAAVAQEEWTAKLSVTLGPLGKKTSRGVKSSEFSTTMPGAPDGDYVLIQFDTSFENKKAAVETVVMTKEADGLWRVSGYFIR